MKSRTVATNRKARHDYFIDETYEAGIVLTGTEIKSARAGRVNLRDSYVQVKDGELWLIDTHIAPYKQAGRSGHEPKRSRKLLMHRREISRLQGKVQEKATLSFPCACISSTTSGPRWRSPWLVVKGSTTSARPSASATPSGRWNARWLGGARGYDNLL